MAVRLPAIAPRPEPTPQERSAALLQSVISVFTQPPKGARGDSGRLAKRPPESRPGSMKREKI
jgi:hypothetical protein